MWNPFTKKVPEITDMSEREKEIIRQFASGSDTLRSSAIEIYRYYIPILGAYGKSPEMNFMSEIDNPIPDYALRAHYRKVLLDN